jgi:hypothetical protein
MEADIKRSLALLGHVNRTHNGGYENFLKQARKENKSGKAQTEMTEGCKGIQ